jgi:ubiquinone/menaquinone biosynthesis C-methylase UbiE
MRRPSFIARQAARPAGFVGRLLLRLMARETSRFNAEVLDALDPQDGERILEIGFGHGRTLVEAARRAPGASFAGIDVASTAAHVGARRCHALIAAGRLVIETGDAAAMHWDAATFDAAFSVHTIYFWPEPAKQLSELRRVVRPGGRVVLGMLERSDAAIAAFPSHTYRFYASDEAAQLFVAAGFREVEVRAANVGDGLRIVIAG